MLLASWPRFCFEGLVGLTVSLTVGLTIGVTVLMASEVVVSLLE